MKRHIECSGQEPEGLEGSTNHLSFGFLPQLQDCNASALHPPPHEPLSQNNSQSKRDAIQVFSGSRTRLQNTQWPHLESIPIFDSYARTPEKHATPLPPEDSRTFCRLPYSIWMPGWGFPARASSLFSRFSHLSASKDARKRPRNGFGGTNPQPEGKMLHPNPEISTRANEKNAIINSKRCSKEIPPSSPVSIIKH